MRLGPYEIVALIGAGGIGEVYKTRDTKLGREVAIKVLPAAFAENKERLARFEREARVLASLNHPNIATLFDLQERDGTHFLVLEFVPGETLAERIRRGAIPVDEALPLFKQIAEGLEAAHEKGIIHRDLKPANVKVTPEGTVKVLDFGLAKALAGEAVSQDLSESPTLTRDATETGVLLGTAPYMSPEQARGKQTDKRTDIWAFGCCLFEALTATGAFWGETVSDTIARILEREPDPKKLPANTPAAIRELLRRCLTRDLRRRHQAIGEARIVIEEHLADQAARSTPTPAAGPAWRRSLPWFAAAASVVAFLVALWSPWRADQTTEQAPLRVRIEMSPETSFDFGPALSPDGNLIAHECGNMLCLRALNQLEAEPISGTEGAYAPFFSPDGKWIGFFAGGQLKKVSVTGGTPVSLCDLDLGRGATFSPDGWPSCRMNPDVGKSM
jgi:serine/threonine-protein kinase